MNKLFTQIIWNYQCFGNFKTDETIDLHNIYKPLEIFQKLLNEIECKAPEVTDEMLKRIHDKAL